MQVSALLPLWELPLSMLSLGLLFLFIFFLLMLASEVSRLITDSQVRVFPGVWKQNSLFFDSLPRTDLHPYLFCLSFYLLKFFPPFFEDNGLLFWVPDVLSLHSEVVLCDLLSIQMFFRLIC